MKKILFAAAAIGYAALAVGSAIAGSVTGGPFTVQVTVQSACVISADVGNVTFTGNGPGNVPQAVNQNPQVQCTNGTPYSVYFTSVNGVTGTPATTRVMQPGAGTGLGINYQIFGCANNNSNCPTSGTGSFAIGATQANALAVPTNGTCGSTPCSGYFNLVFQILNDGSYTGATSGQYSDTVTMTVAF